MLLARRSFLTFAGALGLAGALPARILLAKAPTEQRFVLFLLRGAIDGLAAVPPVGDPDYAAQRGKLAYQPSDTLPLQGIFALNSALPTFGEWYREGDGLVVHAVATPYRERSHFDGQDLLETGSAAPQGLRDGWLNRVLTALGGEARLGLAANQEIPLVLRGRTQVGTWSPGGLPQVDDDFLDRVADLYAEDPLLFQALSEGRQVGALAASALPDGKSALKGPAVMAEGVGRLLANADGPRIAVLEVGGWDTHHAQGMTGGRLYKSLGQLDASFAALRAGLGSAWSETVVVAATEFGRTARVNGSGGTDHGTATCAFVAGGAVAGGRVVADWPGLSDGALYQNRDLAPTQDLRAVLKGLLASHLGIGSRVLADSVFPDSVAVKPLEGLTRA